MNLELQKLPGGVVAFSVWDGHKLLGRLSQDVLPNDVSMAGSWWRFKPNEPREEMTFPMEMALVCVLRDIRDAVREWR